MSWKKSFAFDKQNLYTSKLYKMYILKWNYKNNLVTFLGP